MKILVNASLIREKAPWFEFYPVYINGKLDTNSPATAKVILESKNNQTSFANFATIEKQIGLEKAIVFTIPSKLSGEHDAYTSLNQNKDITIISGQALICNLNKVGEIIQKHPNNPHKIKQKVEQLNKQIKMHALIWNLANLPRKGRLQFVLKMLLHKVGFKMLLQWKNDTWEKNKLGRNGWKLIANHAAHKKEITFVAANDKEPYLLQLIEKCKSHFPNIEIIVKQMTNAMMVHVGKSFLAFY